MFSKEFEILKCILSSLLPSKQTARKSHAVSLELRSIKDPLFFIDVLLVNVLS